MIEIDIEALSSAQSLSISRLAASSGDGECSRQKGDSAKAKLGQASTEQWTFLYMVIGYTIESEGQGPRLKDAPLGYKMPICSRSVVRPCLRESGSV
jgi:hypothetical protein